ncbi:MAG: hypothetical protein MK180_12210 [Rhodobacteraceae bacterium]|nr:hypothetical protein [Paracoccaceae bacterium]
MGTPDYWFRQAEGSQGFMSKWGFYALGMALDAMLPTIRLVTGLPIDAGVTLLDKLADAVYRAAQISREIGEKALRFMSAAMRIAGQFAAKGALTLADITASFLRWVLDLMLAPVKAAARGAISLLS